VTPLAVMCSSLNLLLKGDWIENRSLLPPPPFLLQSSCTLCLRARSIFVLAAIIFPGHGSSHSHPFQPSVADENEIHKLVTSHFLPDHTVLQWRPAASQDIPTPNTNKIVVFASFFQRGFGLPVYNFLRGLLHHYQIELVHLNPNSMAYLRIPPNFPLFKNYFFLKYQMSAANCKVIGGIGLQTRPRAGFLDLPLKNSLQGWHGTWFYYENHEPSLPSFIG
jgi:hypothetical protein